MSPTETVTFAKSYGCMAYVQKTNNESKTSIHIVRDQSKWETQPHADLQ